MRHQYILSRVTSSFIVILYLLVFPVCVQGNITEVGGIYSEKVWGCDLTEGYIKENAYYTT